MPGHWATYRKWKKSCIAGLAAEPRRRISYRPYVHKDFGLEDGEYLTRAFPDLTLLKGGLTAPMLGCRLLVLDHPGTTLYQAMTANVPLVCFWDDRRWPLSEQAEPSFRAPREAGVFFDPPAAAAKPSRSGSVMERVWVAWGSDGVGQFMNALTEMAEQFFKMFTQFKGGSAQTPTQLFAKLHQDDPGMAGCLGLEALWQLVGFFLGWLGSPGRGRALGVSEVKFVGEVLPNAKLVTYHLNFKRIIQRRLILGVADGFMAVDGKPVYEAAGLKVGLFAATEPA